MPDTDADGMMDGMELMLGRDPRTSNSIERALAPDPAPDDAPELPGGDELPPLPPTLPDLTAPNTTISAGPTGTVASGAASFSFTSSESGSSFECRLDGRAWGGCSSPKPYSGLGNGSHTFAVRATDAAGKTDSSPASRTWTVSVAAPPPGNNCMANPTACGFPDVGTTGVTPGKTLTPVNGSVKLSTPGQVLRTSW